MSHTRRDFLRAALGTSTLMSLGATAPDWLTARRAAGGRGDHDTGPVVLQLTGGNDGLNTVVPYADDEYGRNRSTLRLPTTDLHKIDATLGFHPRMGAFLRLYKDGYLTIVQGVGSPTSDQDHDRAMRMWHTAEPAAQPGPKRERMRLGARCPRLGFHGKRVGWAGWWTVPGGQPRRIPPRSVGPIARPFALNAENVVVPSLHSMEDLVVVGVCPSGHSRKGLTASLPTTSLTTLCSKSYGRPTGCPCQERADRGRGQDARWLGRVSAVRAGPGPPHGCPAHSRRDRHSHLLRGAGRRRHRRLRQPRQPTGQPLCAAATVVRVGGGLPRRPPARQAAGPGAGDDLLGVRPHGRENGRRGTDHGAAAPLFLAGGRVKGGLVGPHPSLTDLDNGALKVHTDFRRVYATVLDRWLGFESQPVLGGNLNHWIS